MATAEKALNLAVEASGGTGKLAQKMTELGLKTSRFQVRRWQRKGFAPEAACSTLEEATGIPAKLFREKIEREIGSPPRGV